MNLTIIWFKVILHIHKVSVVLQPQNNFPAVLYKRNYAS